MVGDSEAEAEAENESRTAAFEGKRSLQTSVQGSPSSHTSSNRHEDKASNKHQQNDQMAANANLAPELGHNRLAIGFKSGESISKQEEPTSAYTDGDSPDSPIEISDDEGGGMVINVDTHRSVMSKPSSENESDRSDVMDKDSYRPQSHVDSHITSPTRIRLLDLNSDELEQQLRYAYYHLPRDQIDLNRFIICLTCLQEGHMSDHCQPLEDEKIPSFFPTPTTTNQPVKLWISCCICASKSHLVGDCPDADPLVAKRWSIKSLHPGQITNLSLETGTRRLEREAETKGMRPQGLQIKGRAGLHHASKSSRPTSDDDNEPFIRPRLDRPARQARPELRLGNYETQHRGNPFGRYDRFDAPSSDREVQNRSSNRGRGDWYATDSFGRSNQDSYRPGDDRDSRDRQPRSRSPRRYDGYRQSDYSSFRARTPPPPPSLAADRYRPPQPPNSSLPRHNASIQLPTRKGSNPNVAKNTEQSNRKNFGLNGNNESGGRKNKKGKGSKNSGA